MKSLIFLRFHIFATVCCLGCGTQTATEEQAGENGSGGGNQQSVFPPAPLEGPLLIDIQCGGNQREGLFHVCVLDEAGQISCWGDVLSPPSGEYVSHSGGIGIHCAVDVEGGAACWGPRGSPELVETPVEQVLVVRVDGRQDPTFIETDGGISQGVGSTSFGEQGPFNDALSGQVDCGLLVNGTVVCDWGFSQDLDSSVGWFGSTWTPPPETELSQIVGEETARFCGLTTDGEVICWGRMSPPTDFAPQLSEDPFPGEIVSEVAFSGSTVSGRTPDGRLLLHVAFTSVPGNYQDPGVTYAIRPEFMPSFVVGSGGEEDLEVFSFRDHCHSAGQLCGILESGHVRCWSELEADAGRIEPPPEHFGL